VAAPALRLHPHTFSNLSRRSMSTVARGVVVRIYAFTDAIFVFAVCHDSLGQRHRAEQSRVSKGRIGIIKARFPSLMLQPLVNPKSHHWLRETRHVFVLAVLSMRTTYGNTIMRDSASFRITHVSSSIFPDNLRFWSSEKHGQSTGRVGLCFRSPHMFATSHMRAVS